MAVTGTYSFMGRTAEALERTRRGRRIYQELVDAGRRPAAGVNDPGVVVMCYEAQTLWRTGWPDSAVAMVTEARELATEIQHPHSIAWANCFAAEIHELRGEWALADHYGQANIELERNDPFPHFSDLGWVYASLAQLMLGGPPDLTDTMALHLERYNDANAYLGCTYVWGLLALAYLATGRHHEGLAVVDRAEERLAAWGECYSAPDLARIRGELILAASAERIDEATAEFERALALADQAGLRSYALRAASSLARANVLRGVPDAAIAVLAPRLDAMTEGRTTADVRSAEQLLLEARSGLRPVR